MINNIKKYIQLFLSDSSFIYKTLKSFYLNFYNKKIFFPFNLADLNTDILKRKYYTFNNNNFIKFKKKYDFFLIFDKRLINRYSEKKLQKIIELAKTQKYKLIYDGDCPFNTEIVSNKFLENYSKNYKINSYPSHIFYLLKDKASDVGNIGTNHRSFNFNGSFKLPSGGKSIGDGGDVSFRLNFIPDLKNKTFLDIGSEEGYSVFNAIEKNAKFAKGLNIYEDKEYDFFPDYLRGKSITSRRREDIEKTQNFLIKEYNLIGSSKIEFEYKNIYDLGEDKFDFVFCFGVLYHLKNPYKAMENLFKITNETLVIETQGIRNDRYLNAKIDHDDGFIRHSSNSLKFLLQKTGFKKVDILVDTHLKSWRVSNIVLKAEK